MSIIPGCFRVILTTFYSLYTNASIVYRLKRSTAQAGNVASRMRISTELFEVGGYGTYDISFK